MRGHTASMLLRAPVLVRGIRLGEVEGVILDTRESRILGLDVLCGDGANRFLPFSTARLAGQTIELDSSLMLLDPRELAFYRERGRPLQSVPELAHAMVGVDGALVPV